MLFFNETLNVTARSPRRGLRQNVYLKKSLFLKSDDNRAQTSSSARKFHRFFDVWYFIQEMKKLCLKTMSDKADVRQSFFSL